MCVVDSAVTVRSGTAVGELRGSDPLWTCLPGPYPASNGTYSKTAAENSRVLPVVCDVKIELGYPVDRARAGSSIWPSNLSRSAWSGARPG